MNEIRRQTISGWVMLGWLFLSMLILAGLMGYAVFNNTPWPMIIVVPGAALTFVSLFGFFTVQPNSARVLVLFGQYQGTVRQEGFHWANPFAVPRLPTTRKSEDSSESRTLVRSPFDVSLRARNFESTQIKVNDLRGNPIEIAAVVVWRVTDTAQALFEVDDYEHYVKVQSETALRYLASSYAYDHTDNTESETTLRSGGEVVNNALQKELQARLSKAGVEVLEARLTHLAYAPEIASLMLRRQQAEAVIAARQKIVHGAVSMVQMALEELSAKKVVELDEERKAAMVGNLLVILCGEAEAQPIVNTGTLYH